MRFSRVQVEALAIQACAEAGVDAPTAPTTISMLDGDGEKVADITPLLVRPREAAAILACSERQVELYRRAGLLTPVRLPKPERG